MDIVNFERLLLFLTLSANVITTRITCKCEIPNALSGYKEVLSSDKKNRTQTKFKISPISFPFITVLTIATSRSSTSNKQQQQTKQKQEET